MLRAWRKSGSPPYRRRHLPRHRILAAFWAASALAQVWVNQQSNTTASLRGISAVNVKNVWASGTGGTYVHTSDGGRTWMAAVVPGAEQLDFRGIHAFNSRTVLLVSSGPGDKSKVRSEEHTSELQS